MTEKINRRLQSILTELRQAFTLLYGERLRMLILFGSQARGDAQPDSDIDVLVVLQGPVDGYVEIKRTGDIVSGLSLKFNEVLTCLFVDETEYQTKDAPLFRNVRKEGVPL